MRKLLLLKLIFPIISYCQINQWDYKVSSGDVFSDDKPYVYVVSSDLIDGIYTPVMILSKRGNNDYYSLLISGVGYLSENDDDFMVEIAFDNLKKTVREINAKINNVSGKSVVVIEDKLDNLLIDFRDFNKVSFQFTSYYPSFDVNKFDVTLSGFTKAFNKMDVNFFNKILNDKKKQEKEAKIRDSLYALAMENEDIKRLKRDSLFNYVDKEILPFITKRLRDSNIETSSSDFYDLKAELLDKIKFSLDIGRELSTDDFSNVEIIESELDGTFSIKLFSNKNRLYWISKAVNFKRNVLSKNKITANRFFEKNSGKYEIVLSQFQGLDVKKIDSKKKGDIFITNTKSSIKNDFMGINLRLTPYIPKYIPLNENEMFFTVNNSHLRKGKMTILESNIKFEWDITSNLKTFKQNPSNSYLFKVIKKKVIK